MPTACSGIILEPRKPQCRIQLGGSRISFSCLQTHHCTVAAARIFAIISLCSCAAPALVGRNCPPFCCAKSRWPLPPHRGRYFAVPSHGCAAPEPRRQKIPAPRRLNSPSRFAAQNRAGQLPAPQGPHFAVPSRLRRAGSPPSNPARSSGLISPLRFAAQNRAGRLPAPQGPIFRPRHGCAAGSPAVKTPRSSAPRPNVLLFVLSFSCFLSVTRRFPAAFFFFIHTFFAPFLRPCLYILRRMAVAFSPKLNNLPAFYVQIERKKTVRPARRRGG